MVYQCPKANIDVVENQGKCHRWRKGIFYWERKELQRLADLKKWKSKIKKLST
jgi:hypothetical protein